MLAAIILPPGILEVFKYLKWKTSIPVRYKKPVLNCASSTSIWKSEISGRRNGFTEWKGINDFPIRDHKEVGFVFAVDFE